MNSNTRADGEDAANAALSPGFPTGPAEDGLEKIRTRLLDLTNRNRLLNFRHTTTSTLRVVGVDCDSVFRRLLDGERLAFAPVPEPDLDITADAAAVEERYSKPTAADYAATLGWRTSYDLEAGSTDSEGSRVLPVLHYLEGLETLTRKIGSAAKTAIEESGTNMLYLILGFLEWYEADDSQQPRYAPLLNVPVSLERIGGKGRVFESTIEHSGDEFTSNLSLIEKMRCDFGVEIPAMEDEDIPEDYFAHFSLILEHKKRWRIRRQITLSLLSFGKLLMYRDLDPKAWPGVAKHPLVKELFEGSKTETITHAEEYLIDAPEMQQYVPPLILDADSSQHSALIHALRGQNLVIEGPPGTGKSQTITNLMAAAMAKGKTVLFVAEKLAALEVVRRRLEEAGLGIFCLELHSHKTKKHALLNDIAARLRAQGSFHDPRDLDQHVALVEERKQLLTRYADLIITRIGSFGATVFEILWRREGCYLDLPFSRQLPLSIRDALRLTRTQYAQREQFLSVYAQHLTSVLQVCLELAEHPWAWIARSLTFEEEERVLDLLSDLLGALDELNGLCQTLKQTAAILLEPTIGGTIHHAQQVLAELPEAAQDLDGYLLEPCRGAECRAMLWEFVRDVENAAALFQTLGEVAAHPEVLLRDDTLQGLTTAFEVIKAFELQKLTCSQLRNVLASRKAAETILSEAGDCLSKLETALSCQSTLDAQGARLVLNCLRLLEGAPFEVLHFRAPSLESDGACQAVRNAAQEAKALREKHHELDERFDLSVAMRIADPLRCAEHARSLKEAGILQVWFGRSYRQAVKTYRRIVLTRQKQSRDAMARDFRAIADYSDSLRQFENHPVYREIIGPHFRGLDTQWDQLQLLVGWYEEVFTWLPDHDPPAGQFRELLLKARTERLRALRAALPSHAESRTILEQVQEAIPEISKVVSPDPDASLSIPELLGLLRKANVNLEMAIDTLGSVGLSDDANLEQIPDLLAAAQCYRENRARVAANNLVQELLGAHFKGTDTDLDPIKNAITFAECLIAGKLPHQATDWILSEDYGNRVRQLRALLTHLASCGERLMALGTELNRLTEATVWSTNAQESLEALQQKAERALANREELPRWVHFVRVQAESREIGLAKLTSLADSKGIEPQHLVPAFRYLFYDSLARGVFAEHPELSRFSGLAQEELRKQFTESDTQAIRLYRERAASIIDRRPVPYGNRSGPVGGWTDLALITHEISKQKRHIPIRQLVRRAGAALLALKPCFMMGPLSVAQYLAPGELHFDLVVMDEA
jgi:hypothetical protein